MSKMRFLSAFVVIVGVFAIVKSDENAALDAVVPKPQGPKDPGVAARDKLLDSLLKNYKTYNYPENSTTQFGIAIRDVHFDDTKGFMHADLWLRYVWTDSRLKWDNETTGISVIRVPPKMIWVPDFTLYNSVDKDMNCWESNVLIYPNGRVLWVPPCQVTTFCNITLSKHPYGEQECMMKFGSWTFDGFTMGLEFYSNKQKADLTDYEGAKYKVTKNEVVKEEKYYECCEEPYLTLQYTLGFTKNAECPKNAN